MSSRDDIQNLLKNIEYYKTIGMNAYDEYLIKHFLKIRLISSTYITMWCLYAVFLIFDYLSVELSALKIEISNIALYGMPWLESSLAREYVGTFIIAYLSILIFSLFVIVARGIYTLTLKRPIKRLTVTDH